MNHLLRLRIWPSFLASSGVGPYDVPFMYASESRGNAGRLPGTRRKRLRCAWHAHLRGLATAIHEISGLNDCSSSFQRSPKSSPAITANARAAFFRTVLLLSVNAADSASMARGSLILASPSTALPLTVAS